MGEWGSPLVTCLTVGRDVVDPQLDQGEIQERKQTLQGHYSVFYINSYSCVLTSWPKKMLFFKVTRKTEEVNRPRQFLKKKHLNYILPACGKLTLLARLGVNWRTPEELSHSVFTYKIANQSEIPCISLIDVISKMKLISWFF